LWNGSPLFGFFIGADIRSESCVANAPRA
jgi:hypothetical protein